VGLILTKYLLSYMLKCEKLILSNLILNYYHHRQPIDVPTADAQAFVMVYPQGVGHNPPRGPNANWWVLMTANTAGTNRLTCLPKHGGARDIKSDDRPMLLSFRDRTSSALPAGLLFCSNLDVYNFYIGLLCN
jgi:hypothetical protein